VKSRRIFVGDVQGCRVELERLLEKAEHLCLVSNSLRGQRHLITEIVTTD